MVVSRPLKIRSHKSSGRIRNAGAKEAAQCFGRLVGNLFREEVAAMERMAPHLVGPCSPQSDRPGLLRVPSRKRPFGAPHDENRAGYPASFGAVRAIVFPVNGRGRSILLTDRVRVRGS
jgi:hypothetical protein